MARNCFKFNFSYVQAMSFFVASSNFRLRTTYLSVFTIKCNPHKIVFVELVIDKLIN